MPSVKINGPTENAGSISNPLPELLQTPAGLAILEIQGSIHAPFANAAGIDGVRIGHLEFPLYDKGSGDKEGPWMKRVHLYIGNNQRLSGEIKKLPKPLAVLSHNADPYADMSNIGSDHEIEQLNILAIVKYKLLFSSRPEPVGL